MTKLLASFSIIFCGVFFFDRKWTDVTQQKGPGLEYKSSHIIRFQYMAKPIYDRNEENASSEPYLLILFVSFFLD